MIEASILATLLTGSNRMDALENGGVDNWEWYGESLSNYRDEHPEGINSLDVTEQDVIDKYVVDKYAIDKYGVVQ